MSVRNAAATFAQQESKLDILWNNAGTGPYLVKPGARTAQGLEAMVGMHCVAVLLLTQLLLPQLRTAVTAASETPGSVRVVWTSSYMAESATQANSIEFDLLEQGTTDRPRNYAVSKMGNWLLGREMARRYGKDGIVSVTQNPGSVMTGAYGQNSKLVTFFMNRLLYEAKLGGYTELYAGLSPDLMLETNGAYIIPWGRVRLDKDCPRKDIVKALTPEEDGGLGYSSKFWDWCEQQWKQFSQEE